MELLRCDADAGDVLAIARDMNLRDRIRRWAEIVHRMRSDDFGHHPAGRRKREEKARRVGVGAVGGIAGKRN